MRISEMGMTGDWFKNTVKMAEKGFVHHQEKKYETSLAGSNQEEKKKDDAVCPQVSVKEIYQRMCPGNGEEMEAEQESCETSGTDTEILVKADGSRVLVMTMHMGGMETTMSMEISKPTDMQNDKGGEISDRNTGNNRGMESNDDKNTGNDKISGSYGEADHGSGVMAVSNNS